MPTEATANGDRNGPDDFGGPHRALSDGRPGRWVPIAVSTLVVASAIGLTFLAWQQSRQVVEEKAAQRFAFEAEDVSEAIIDRMVSYEQMLWSGVGLFNASEEVSRQEWRLYTESLGLQERWPGIQGIGYAVPLRPDELEAHLAAVRAEGFPEYSVRPPGPRAEYSSIVFLEPFDERNQQAFGFDMWSNAVRREAMARARDTGQAATSGAITLVQEIDEDVQRGFLTYVPVYSTGAIPDTVAARRAAFVGWVYAPFRAGDLMNGILGADLDSVGFELYDSESPDPEALLFDSDGELNNDGFSDEDFTEVRNLEIQGRTWTAVIHSGPGFVNASEAREPTLVVLAGLGANLLIVSILGFVWVLKRRATVLAEQMTVDLRRTSEALEVRTAELEVHATELEASYIRAEAAKEELTVLNEELEQFIYTAAHDLQAPLRVIASYASMVDDGSVELSPDQLDCLDRVERSSSRMSDLLVDLLTYARVRWDRAPTVVDLRQLVETVVADLVGREHDQVTIGPLPPVLGHEPYLRILLQNLVDNALKFAKPDEPLRVEITSEPIDGGIVVSVADNGVGFDQDYAEKIFSVFQRLDHTGDRAGTGIGLANCRKIARMHSGDAWATSEPGVGSTFSFSIRTGLIDVAESGAAAEAPPTAAAVQDGQRPS